MPLVINDQLVSEQVLQNELLRLSAGLQMDAPQAGGLDPEQLQALALRNVVARTLLLQLARDRGMRVTAAQTEAERALRWGSVNNTVCSNGVHQAIAEDLLVEQARSELTRHVPRPSRTETEEFYRRNRQLYFLPEGRLAAHIVRNIRTPADEPPAQQLLLQAEAELSQGKPFALVADRYSECQGVGGSVGWIARGQMVLEFEEIVFALDVGERSGIFQTIFGMHLATVLRKRNAGYRPFEEVRFDIAARVLADRRQHALAQAIAGMERISRIYFTTEGAHA